MTPRRSLAATLAGFAAVVLCAGAAADEDTGDGVSAVSDDEVTHRASRLRPR